MTDGSRWTPPEGAPAGPGATPWSTPAPPPPGAGSGAGFGAPYGPESAYPGAPGGPGTGWTPPPKPGLVPLRPMTLGTILGAMFQVMRRNPLPTFGLALLLTLASSIITLGLLALAFLPFAAGSSIDDAGAIAGAIGIAAIGGLAGAAAQLVVYSVIQGTVTLEVASGTLGERMRLGGLWRRLRPRLPRMIGWLLLLVLACTIAFGALIALVVGVAALGDQAADAAVAIALVGSLGLTVLAIWIGFKLVFVVPSIVLEQRGVFASIARSWQLTQGYFWRTFGIVLLVYVIYVVAGSVVSFPIQIIVSIGIALLGSGGDESSALIAVGVLYAVSLLVGWLIGAVGLVMLSATVALLHIDTRMRKEGLDQELIRAAEARAAGTSYPDPYAGAAASAGPSTYGAPTPDSPWA